MRITNLQLTAEDYNQILRILYKLQGETYTILIDNDDTLEIIYHKILTRMIERNKKSLLYDYNSFKKLTILVNIIQENDREKCNELKQRIQKDFENIEKSDKTLIEKIEDAIIVSHHYSYDLPLAQKKRDK